MSNPIYILELYCRKSCVLCTNWTVVNLYSLIYLWIEFKMKSTIHILHYILAFKYRENTIIQSESTFNAVKSLLKLFPQTWVQIFYKVHVILNVFLSYTETDSLPKQIYSLVCEKFAQKHANLIHFLSYCGLHWFGKTEDRQKMSIQRAFSCRKLGLPSSISYPNTTKSWTNWTSFLHFGKFSL